MNYLSFFGLFRNPQPSSQKQNILFIGDSITADPKWSYPALIKNQRGDLSVDVLAKGGQTTSWMLLNLPPRLRGKRYNKVFIYGGVNDAMNDSVKTSTTISNVQKMIDLARNNGAQVYVILGYEPNGFMDYRKMPTTRYVPNRQGYIPMIEKYKNIQSMYASQLRNAIIIPKINLGTLNSDGIHPNTTGQNVIARTINNYL